MEQNYLICHKDIADIGYFFLDREQEKIYLKSINDELALRVGNEIAHRLSANYLRCICSKSQEKKREYIKESIPDIEEMVTKIRKNFLKELKERRGSILIETT